MRVGWSWPGSCSPIRTGTLWRLLRSRSNWPARAYQGGQQEYHAAGGKDEWRGKEREDDRGQGSGQPHSPREAENERERHATEQDNKVAGGGKVMAGVEATKPGTDPPYFLIAIRRAPDRVSDAQIAGRFEEEPQRHYRERGDRDQPDPQAAKTPPSKRRPHHHDDNHADFDGRAGDMAGPVPVRLRHERPRHAYGHNRRDEEPHDESEGHPTTDTLPRIRSHRLTGQAFLPPTARPDGPPCR
jgi:hypothetical protein